MSTDAFAILGVVVVVATLLYAVQPLLRPGRRRPGERARIAARAEEDQLLDEREAAYRALAELDLDRQLGNLDEADYRDLRERYRQRAVAVLRALDGHEPELDEQIEQAVALHRVARREEASRGVLAQRAATQPRVPRRVGGRDLPERPVAEPGRRQTWAWIALGGVFMFAGAALTLYLAFSRDHAAQTPLATVDVAAPRGLAATAGPAPLLYLGAADGLLRSRDLGRTWVPVAEVDSAARAVLASPDGTQPVYAATETAIERSPDGSRWERTGPAPSPRLVALAHGSRPDTLYAASDDGSLYRSPDGGATWTTLPGKAPAPLTALAVLPGAPDLLVVGTDGQGVLASEDDGATWHAANGFANGLLDSTHVRALLFDPNSGDTATAPNGRTFHGTLYVGTEFGLSRSLDAGASWSRLPFHGDVRVLGAGVGNGGPAPLYLLDAQSRLYRSFDRGITWPGAS